MDFEVRYSAEVLCKELSSGFRKGYNCSNRDWEDFP
jgi:hypothetical protein